MYKKSSIRFKYFLPFPSTLYKRPIALATRTLHRINIKLSSKTTHLFFTKASCHLSRAVTPVSWRHLDVTWFFLDPLSPVSMTTGGTRSRGPFVPFIELHHLLNHLKVEKLTVVVKKYHTFNTPIATYSLTCKLEKLRPVVN